MKTQIIGPDAGQQLEARVLNRVIRCEEAGIIWETDPRHVEIMIKQMGLRGTKHLKTPGVREEKKGERIARGHQHDHRQQWTPLRECDQQGHRDSEETERAHRVDMLKVPHQVQLAQRYFQTFGEDEPHGHQRWRRGQPHRQAAKQKGQ